MARLSVFAAEDEVALARREVAVAEGGAAQQVAGEVDDRVVVDQVEADGAGARAGVHGHRVGRAGAGDAGDRRRRLRPLRSGRSRPRPRR